MENKETHSMFQELKENLETTKRHIKIIETLMIEQPAGILKISQTTGIPGHKIRYSLRILEKAGVIEPSMEGAFLSPDFINNKGKMLEELRQILKDLEETEERLKKLLGK